MAATCGSLLGPVTEDAELVQCGECRRILAERVNDRPDGAVPGRTVNRDELTARLLATLGDLDRLRATTEARVRRLLPDVDPLDVVDPSGQSTLAAIVTAQADVLVALARATS